MRAWEEFVTNQENIIGKPIADKWLRPLKVARFDACNLYLEAPDSFYTVWFDEHIRHKLKKELLNNNGKPIRIHLQLPEHIEKTAQEKQQKKKQSSRSFHTAAFEFYFDEIDPEKSFKNFITTQSNLLAYKLIAEAAGYNLKTETQGKTPLQFNPIYLFGRSGVGKTHLLMAAAQQLKNLKKKVIYTKAETFTEHVVNAIRTGEMQTFRKTYRNIDTLIVDDIELFARKGATQEELFHTFNTLHIEGKQIILSSALPPSELKFIEARLVSRFEWGIVIPLQPLGSEKMQEVLVAKALKMNFPLEDTVVSFLLSTFHTNTKSLLRALEALILRTHLNQSLGTPPELPIKLTTAKKYLKDLIQEEEKAILTPPKIIRMVAEYYGIKMDDILSKSQSRECVLPRQIAMHLCRDLLNLPFMQIGELFARDHSTVMTSCKLVQKGIEKKSLEITSSYQSILKRLQAH